MQSLIRRNSLLVLAAAATLAQAAPLPEAGPDEVGFSPERLGRVDAAMQKAVDSGELPGEIGRASCRERVCVPV